MKVVIYRRTSTVEQCLSLAAQKEKLNAYCGLHDLEIVADFSDQLSGKDTDRPGFQQALSMLKAGEADALVVYKMDRLSRNVRDVLDLCQLCSTQGWQLHSICERLDTGSATGRFTITLLAALAQMEREQIGERVSMALKHKIANGEPVGTPGLGWRYEDSQLVSVAEEQKVLHEIHQLHQRMTLRDVADELNRRGVLTKTGKSRWHASTVQYVLKHSRFAD